MAETRRGSVHESPARRGRPNLAPANKPAQNLVTAVLERSACARKWLRGALPRAAVTPDARRTSVR